MLRSTFFRQSSSLVSVVTSAEARLQHFLPKRPPKFNEAAFKHAHFEIQHARIPWAVESLSKVHQLLKENNSTEALKHTRGVLQHCSPSDTHFQADYLSRAVDLFVSSQDFSSAIDLTNYMITEHIPVSTRVWIALLTGDELFESAYREQILSCLANVDESLIDRAVRMRLCEMGRLGESPARMERFFRQYILQRVPGRQLSLQNVATVGWVIQAFLRIGDHDHAQRLLQEYRVQQKNCIHDQSNQTRGERSVACFPYTTMLHTLRHAKQPDFVKLNNIIIWMDEDSIVPDSEFFNKTIHIMRRWGWYDAILPLYQSMYQYDQYPLPTPATFRALFITIASGNSLETRSISHRMIFRDMLAMHQSQAGIMPAPYLSEATIVTALKAFTMRYDYAAIIALFQACVVFKITLSKSQLDVLPQILRSRVEKIRKNTISKNRTDKNSRLIQWISLFVGSRSIDECLAELQARARTMSDSQLAVLTKALPRQQAEQIWPFMQFAYYALQARLGYPVFWQHLDSTVGDSSSSSDSVEDILAEDILRAFNSMVEVNQRQLFLSADPSSNTSSTAAVSSPVEDKLFLEELQRETKRLALGRGPVVRRNISLRELDRKFPSPSSSPLDAQSAAKAERISWKDRMTDSVEEDFDDLLGDGDGGDIFDESSSIGQGKVENDAERAEKVEILLARLRTLLNH